MTEIKNKKITSCLNNKHYVAEVVKSLTTSAFWKYFDDLSLSEKNKGIIYRKKYCEFLYNMKKILYYLLLLFGIYAKIWHIINAGGVFTALK